MKSKFLTLFLVVITSCANLSSPNTVINCSFPEDNSYAGGLINISISSNERALEDKLRIEDLKFSICRSDELNFVILAPVPLSYTKKEVKLTLSDQPIAVIDLKDKFYRESRIEIKNQDFVSPPRTMQERIRDEYLQLQKAKNTYTQRVLKEFNMDKPLDGITSSEFGVKRYINNEPRNRHIGLDIANKEGTPITAPLDGKIILSDNFFYKGNVIYIDHGGGLVTSYSHLSYKEAKLNKRISKGDILGYVGSTGRVTGPHLHWEVYYLGIPINPEIFLDL